MTEYTYTLDQLREVTEEQVIALFLNYKNVQKYGGVKLHNYSTADSGTIKASSPQAACEELFRIYNIDLPAGYAGRSMSVSDIVHLWDNTTDTPVKTSWFCDSFGFVQIDENGKAVQK